MFKLIEIGLKDIDAQHEILVENMNELYQMMKIESNDELIMNSIKKLEFYVSSHFKYEEENMKFYHYPEMENHIKMHQHFVRKLYEMKENIDDGSKLLATDLLSFLRIWLLDHIGKEDLKIAHHISSEKRK